MARKLIEIEMDKKRYLQAGMNTMILLEKELGHPLSELGEKSITIEDMRTMFYCLLKNQDKDLTPDKVGDLMDITIEAQGMDYLSEKLAEVMKGAFGGKAAFPSNN